jgi:hypothetical protein
LFQPFFGPSGFLIETDPSVKTQKFAVAINDIKSSAELELPEANRAEGERPGIALL